MTHTGLTYIEDVEKRDGILYCKYKCNVCKAIVIRARNNAKKVRSCGCNQHVKIERCWPLYKKYLSIVTNYKYRDKNMPKEWENSFKFETWCLENGYTIGKMILRKDIKKEFSPNNCLILDKKKGYSIVKSRQNIVYNETSEYKIKNEVIKYSGKYPLELDLVLFNLAALKLKMPVSIVFKVCKNIKDTYVDTINIGNRSHYKRALHLFQYEKKG